MEIMYLCLECAEILLVNKNLCKCTICDQDNIQYVDEREEQHD